MTQRGHVRARCQGCYDLVFALKQGVGLSLFTEANQPGCEHFLHLLACDGTGDMSTGHCTHDTYTAISRLGRV